MISMKKIFYVCIADILLILSISLIGNNLIVNKKKKKEEYNSITIRLCNENERI